jgi:putative SOS response-associated peptidase YedK
MCGRFSNTANFEKLMSFYNAELGVGIDMDWQGNYNVSPTQVVPVIIDGDEGREIVPMKWGLVPFWAKDPKIGNTMINARAETVDGKPGFRDSFKDKRCIVPATGFYEWKKIDKEKQPYYFQPTEGLFSFAGLWSRWNSPEGKQQETFTIITTAANDVVKPVHDRMPVALGGSNAMGAWLAKDTFRKELLELLQPFPDDRMGVHQVSKYVNSPKNCGPECIIKNSE